MESCSRLLEFRRARPTRSANLANRSAVDAPAASTPDHSRNPPGRLGPALFPSRGRVAGRAYGGGVPRHADRGGRTAGETRQVYGEVACRKHNVRTAARRHDGPAGDDAGRGVGAAVLTVDAV